MFGGRCDGIYVSLGLQGKLCCVLSVIWWHVLEKSTLEVERLGRQYGTRTWKNFAYLRVYFIFVACVCSGRLMSHVFSRVLPPERRRGVKKESHPCLIMYKISRLHESISVSYL